MKKMQLQSYAPIVVRYGMSIVILWFALQQFLHPATWVAYVPDGAVSITHMSAMTLVYLNALFEATFGTLLLLGWYTRIVALLLALHLFDIMWIVGYGEIGVRDFGLAIATFSVFLSGHDRFCLDHEEVLHDNIDTIPEPKPAQRII
jgi:uncharacterized membrane protein YphA (DoxX/SURF4 family)